MRAFIALSCAAAMAVLAAGCTTTTAPGPSAEITRCPTGQTRANTVELVFGRNDGDRLWWSARPTGYGASSTRS